MFTEKETSCDCDPKDAHLVFIVFADVMDGPVEVSVIMEKGALEISIEVFRMLG